MRVREPSLREFFMDLILLALVVPATALIINFFISGLGPYDFTVFQLMESFYFSVNVFFLKLQPLIDLFWLLALCIATALVLWWLISLVGGFVR